MQPKRKIESTKDDDLASKKIKDSNSKAESKPNDKPSEQKPFSSVLQIQKFSQEFINQAYKNPLGYVQDFLDFFKNKKIDNEKLSFKMDVFKQYFCHNNPLEKNNANFYMFSYIKNIYDALLVNILEDYFNKKINPNIILNEFKSFQKYLMKLQIKNIAPSQMEIIEKLLKIDNIKELLLISLNVNSEQYSPRKLNFFELKDGIKIFLPESRKTFYTCEKINSGGFSIIYKATDFFTNENVALSIKKEKNQLDLIINAAEKNVKLKRYYKQVKLISENKEFDGVMMNYYPFKNLYYHSQNLALTKIKLKRISSLFEAVEELHSKYGIIHNDISLMNSLSYLTYDPEKLFIQKINKDSIPSKEELTKIVNETNCVYYIFIVQNNLENTIFVCENKNKELIMLKNESLNKLILKEKLSYEEKQDILQLLKKNVFKDTCDVSIYKAKTIIVDFDTSKFESEKSVPQIDKGLYHYLLPEDLQDMYNLSATVSKYNIIDSLKYLPFFSTFPKEQQEIYALSLMISSYKKRLLKSEEDKEQLNIIEKMVSANKKRTEIFQQLKNKESTFTGTTSKKQSDVYAATLSSIEFITSNSKNMRLSHFMKHKLKDLNSREKCCMRYLYSVVKRKADGTTAGEIAKTITAICDA